MRSSVASTSWL